MLYTLTLHSTVCQLYLNKTGIRRKMLVMGTFKVIEINSLILHTEHWSCCTSSMLTIHRPFWAPGRPPHECLLLDKVNGKDLMKN